MQTLKSWSSQRLVPPEDFDRGDFAEEDMPVFSRQPAQHAGSGDTTVHF